MRCSAPVTRFPDHPQLAQDSGLTWERRATGRFVSQDTRLTKVGNVYLRSYPFLGADRWRQLDLTFHAYSWRKYQEGPNHQHKRALVLTARKRSRLIHALLTKNRPYTVRPQTPLHPEEIQVPSRRIAPGRAYSFTAAGRSASGW